MGKFVPKSVPIQQRPIYFLPCPPHSFTLGAASVSHTSCFCEPGFFDVISGPNVKCDACPVRDANAPTLRAASPPSLTTRTPAKRDDRVSWIEKRRRMCVRTGIQQREQRGQILDRAPKLGERYCLCAFRGQSGCGHSCAQRGSLPNRSFQFKSGISHLFHQG